MQKHHQVSTQVLTLGTPALKSANTEKSLNESIGITVYVKKKNKTKLVKFLKNCQENWGYQYLLSNKHQTNLMSLGKAVIVKPVRLLNVAQLRG